MTIQLTVMSLDFDSAVGPETKVFDKKEITLGSLPSNDVVLDRPEVSGFHAKLRLGKSEDNDGATLYITDLGSSNGTLVENSSLSSDIEVEMQPEQRIIIGNYLIKPQVIASAAESLDTIETPQQNGFSPVNGNGELSSSLTTPPEETPLESNPRPSSLFTHETETQPEEAESRPSTAETLLHAAALAVDPKATSIMSADTTATMLASQADFSHTRTDESLLSTQVGSLSAEREDAPTSRKSLRPSEFKNDPSAYSKDGKRSGVIDGSDVVELDFLAVELFTLGGRVTHKGQALEGVEVNGGFLGKTQTDSDGRYQFEEVREGGHYMIVVSKPKFLLSKKEE